MITALVLNHKSMKQEEFEKRLADLRGPDNYGYSVVEAARLLLELAMEGPLREPEVTYQAQKGDMRIAGRLLTTTAEESAQARQVWARCEELGIKSRVEGVVEKFFKRIEELKKDESKEPKVRREGKA